MDKITFLNIGAMNNLLAALRAGNISWREFGVGVVIAGFAGRDDSAFPSSATIGEMCGLDERNVRRVVKAICKAGVFTSERRPGRSSIIHITPGSFDAPPRAEITRHPGLLQPDTPGSFDAYTESSTYTTTDTVMNEQQTHQTHKSKTAPNGKPKVERTDSGFNVPDTIRAAWVAAYPDIDIDGELAKAHAWCLTNPTKACARKDWGRFLNGWLGRARPTPTPSGGGISQEEADRYNAQWLEWENGSEAESCQAV